ncbi:unnamed protein product [Ceratitis capitata]|uniref:(Mediterranean fruit fly) hypothetical protein n=1 Tax=Ceratitis capitata TaxID=7213 RepID=A0A811UXY2_CERCA|nr:unnamed protein product [Ceratitis capitata]
MYDVATSAKTATTTTTHASQPRASEAQAHNAALAQPAVCTYECGKMHATRPQGASVNKFEEHESDTAPHADKNHPSAHSTCQHNYSEGDEGGSGGDCHGVSVQVLPSVAEKAYWMWMRLPKRKARLHACDFFCI